MKKNPFVSANENARANENELFEAKGSSTHEPTTEIIKTCSHQVALQPQTRDLRQSLTTTSVEAAELGERVVVRTYLARCTCFPAI